MKMHLLALLILLTHLGCAISAEGDNEPPLRVVKVDHILVLSTLARLKEFPQSFGEKLATVGRNISQFNSILEESFSRNIASSLVTSNTKTIVIFAASNLFAKMQPESVKKRIVSASRVCKDLQTMVQCMREEPKDVPQLVVVVDPAEVKMNIPGSFSGTFLASVFEASSGERVWEDRFLISRLATPKSHEEVGQFLAEKIVEKLKMLGFI